MPKTKTLYFHVAYIDWDTKKFKYECHKTKFYLNQEEPDDPIYYYDKGMDGGVHKERIGVVTNYHYGSYGVYTQKKSKEEIMNLFTDYFFDLINRFEEEQRKIMNEIRNIIYEEWKEVK